MVDRNATKQKRHLDPAIAALVAEAEQALPTCRIPDPPKIKKFHGLEDTYTYKLGRNWRLLFHLDASTGVATILHIGPRGNVYDKFERSRRP